MNELKIINNLRKIINNPSALNLYDDVFFDKKKSLVVSIDTYNEKIHYLNFKYPNLLIKKVIRSSISDLICKGVDPKYLLISFSGSKKNFNKKNIKLILKSLKQEQSKFKFSIIGGDTSSSTISSFTICSIGYSKKIIKRNKSLVNDDIFLTGNIGDSSVGLHFLKYKSDVPIKYKNYFIDKYFKPNLAFGFHKDLNKFANSSIDVSDGLLIDLKNLLNNQKMGFVVDFSSLPKSLYFNQLIKQKKILINDHLFNGDDYQILFTAKKKYRKKILETARKWNQKISMIGTIISRNDNYLKINRKLKKIKKYQGYIHNFN